MLSFIIYILVGALWFKYETNNRLKGLTEKWYPEYVFDSKSKGEDYFSEKVFSLCISIIFITLFVFLWPALLIAIIMRMFKGTDNK